MEKVEAASNESIKRPEEPPLGFLQFNMSLEEDPVKDTAEMETSHSKEVGEVILSHIASSPMDPFPPKDFRGKFKKLRQKKRPTILESRSCSKL